VFENHIKRASCIGRYFDVVPKKTNNDYNLISRTMQNCANSGIFLLYE